MVSIQNEFFNIQNLSLNKLRDLYFKKYNKNKIYKDKIIINNHISQMKLNKYNLRKGLNPSKRSYSTLIRQGLGLGRQGRVSIFMSRVDQI